MNILDTKSAQSLTFQELKYIEENKIIPTALKMGIKHYKFIYPNDIVEIKNCYLYLYLAIMGHDAYRIEYFKRLSHGSIDSFERFRNEEYVKWRNQVLENNICIKCGDIATHAHHIYNKADNKNLIFNISNGVPMCKKCHVGFHSKYGYKNTNKIQLEDYVNDNK